MTKLSEVIKKMAILEARLEKSEKRAIDAKLKSKETGDKVDRFVKSIEKKFATLYSLKDRIASIIKSTDSAVGVVKSIAAEDCTEMVDEFRKTIRDVRNISGVHLLKLCVITELANFHLKSKDRGIIMVAAAFACDHRSDEWWTNHDEYTLEGWTEVFKEIARTPKFAEANQ